MTAISRKDGIFCALAVAVLLIGTATGSAIAMFAMSIIALSLATLFYRKQFDGLLMPTALAAAIAALAAGAIMSMR